jgi:hypothetical protein
MIALRVLAEGRSEMVLNAGINGRVRVSISADGDARVALVGEDNVERMVLATGGERPAELLILDEEGGTRAELYLEANEATVLGLRDDSSTTRLTVGLDDMGDAEIAGYRSDGHATYLLRPDQDSTPTQRTVGDSAESSDTSPLAVDHETSQAGAQSWREVLEENVEDDEDRDDEPADEAGEGARSLPELLDEEEDLEHDELDDQDDLDDEESTDEDELDGGDDEDAEDSGDAEYADDADPSRRHDRGSLPNLWRPPSEEARDRRLRKESRFMPEQPAGAGLIDEWCSTLGVRREAAIECKRSCSSDGTIEITPVAFVPRLRYTLRSSGGDPIERQGGALLLVAQNLSDVDVEHFAIGTKALLVDDRGHQYSSKDAFSWVGPDRHIHHHASTIAAHARQEGFLWFPTMHPGSTCFVRFHLADGYWKHGSFVKATWIVKLD